MSVGSKLNQGDRPMLAEFERSGVGLRINIKAHPVVEDFMRRSLGGDDPIIQSVDDFGRAWEPARGDSKKELLVYGIPKELNGVFQVSGGNSYRLDRPGQAIFVNGDGIESRGAGRVLNLSFLRLVGISEEGGVTFHIGGIYSDETIDNLDRALNLATKEVYNQFMKPIKITVEFVVSSSGEERNSVHEVPPLIIQEGTEVVE